MRQGTRQQSFKQGGHPLSIYMNPRKGNGGNGGEVGKWHRLFFHFHTSFLLLLLITVGMTQAWKPLPTGAAADRRRRDDGSGGGGVAVTTASSSLCTPWQVGSNVSSGGVPLAPPKFLVTNADCCSYAATFSDGASSRASSSSPLFAVFAHYYCYVMTGGSLVPVSDEAIMATQVISTTTTTTTTTTTAPSTTTAAPPPAAAAIAAQLTTCPAAEFCHCEFWCEIFLAPLHQCVRYVSPVDASAQGSSSSSAVTSSDGTVSPVYIRVTNTSNNLQVTSFLDSTCSTFLNQRTFPWQCAPEMPQQDGVMGELVPWSPSPSTHVVLQQCDPQNPQCVGCVTVFEGLSGVCYNDNTTYPPSFQLWEDSGSTLVRFHFRSQEACSAAGESSPLSSVGTVFPRNACFTLWESAYFFQTSTTSSSRKRR